MSTKIIILVALGGAVGALTRFLSVAVLSKFFGGPLSILAMNSLGSFAMGILCSWGGGVDPVVRGLVAVGFLGSLTTFSTFSMDLGVMIQQGQYLLFLGYALLSVFCGVGAFLAGWALVKGA